MSLKGRPGFLRRHDSFHLQSRGNGAHLRRERQTPGVAVDEFLADTRHVEREWVTPYLYRFEDSDAIRHLFRVAASLDSMVVGEPQILGQLKSAYSLAKEHGAVSGFMDTLLTRAFNVAKRVRSETDIGENAVSISYAAVELAREIFGSLHGKKIMIVGAGKMSRTRGPPSAAQRRGPNPGHQPHARARARNGGAVRWQARRLHALPLGPAGSGHRHRVQRRAALHHRSRRHEEGAGGAPQQARCS